MTLDQVQTVLVAYEERLRELEADPKRADTSLTRPSEAQALRHLAWMCQQMREVLKSDSPNSEKVARWLGFVQGVSWMTGLFSIDEMRDHNR